MLLGGEKKKKWFPFGVRMQCDNNFFFNKQTSWHMNVFHAWHEKYFKKESSSRRSAKKRRKKIKRQCSFNALIHQVTPLRNVMRLHCSCLPVLPVSLFYFPIVFPVQAIRLMGGRPSLCSVPEGECEVCTGWSCLSLFHKFFFSQSMRRPAKTRQHDLTDLTGIYSNVSCHTFRTVSFDNMNISRISPPKIEY